MSIQKSLNTIAAVLFFIIVLPNLLFSQSVQVTNVLDGNLLQLRNGQIVRLSGVYVPSTIDTNETLSQIAGEIKKFSEMYFVNRYFRIKYNQSLPDSTKLVCLYREYAMGDDEDVATVFLKNGFAACIDSSDPAKQHNYARYEKEAQNSQTGIWSLVPSDYFKNGVPPASSKVKDIKSDRYLPMAGNTQRRMQLQNYNYMRPPILKDPTLAGVLSFIVPGTGQFYNEDPFGGLLYFFGTGFCYYKYFSSIRNDNGEFKSDFGYLLAGTVIHILSIFEAAKSANEYNKEVYFSLNKVKDNYYVSLRLPLNF
ncbi:MAG: hypothetical protein HF309_17710 [Ignavibacteria bacterium]|jgi:endonuclease YncB( thermonuclease family)/TM2 domain-containing membrane protein YozV|nr:hypothetical protein [Ignavibacteria bacterium]MCU7501113.1 hypothetical protein [Ignavibacteria bacterium]MCU7522016.1 hypothetical protein [Ignavibacteria bacterium]MCU7525306.1 hypothetical protein [Ignavibacteria bacterium]HEX2960936.1 thermonuclease family protein [Ignavibacteriales bacterium]